jgi:hypothetical protein
MYDSRYTPFEPSELPAICVFTAEDSVTQWSRNTTLNKRAGSIQVTAFVTGGDEATLAASQDAIAESIVDSLMGDCEWVGAFESVDSAKVQRWQPEDRVKYPCFGVTVTLEVKYSQPFVARVPAVDLTALYVNTNTTTPDGALVSDRPVSDITGEA